MMKESKISENTSKYIISGKIKSENPNENQWRYLATVDEKPYWTTEYECMKYFGSIDEAMSAWNELTKCFSEITVNMDKDSVWIRKIVFHKTVPVYNGQKEHIPNNKKKKLNDASNNLNTAGDALSKHKDANIPDNSVDIKSFTENLLFLFDSIMDNDSRGVSDSLDSLKILVEKTKSGLTMIDFNKKEPAPYIQEDVFPSHEEVDEFYFDDDEFEADEFVSDTFLDDTIDQSTEMPDIPLPSPAKPVIFDDELIDDETYDNIILFDDTSIVEGKTADGTLDEASAGLSIPIVPDTVSDISEAPDASLEKEQESNEEGKDTIPQSTSPKTINTPDTETTNISEENAEDKNECLKDSQAIIAENSDEITVSSVFTICENANRDESTIDAKSNRTEESSSNLQEERTGENQEKDENENPDKKESRRLTEKASETASDMCNHPTESLCITSEECGKGNTVEAKRENSSETDEEKNKHFKVQNKEIPEDITDNVLEEKSNEISIPILTNTSEAFRNTSRDKSEESIDSIEDSENPEEPADSNYDRHSNNDDCLTDEPPDTPQKNRVKEENEVEKEKSETDAKPDAQKSEPNNANIAPNAKNPKPNSRRKRHSAKKEKGTEFLSKLRKMVLG